MVDILQNFTSISEKPGKLLLRVERHMPKILASFMLIYVFVSIEHTLHINDYDISCLWGEPGELPVQFIADVIMFVSAIAILILRDIPNSKVLSIYLLSLSLTRILINYHNLFSVNTMMFAYGVLMCTISLNMLATGVFFYKGISRNRDSVMVSSLLMVVVYAMILSFYVHYLGDVWYVLRENLPTLLQLFLYLILFITLDSYDVHVNTDMGRIDATVRSMRARTGAGERTVLSVHEMGVIANGFGNMEGWTRIDDGGPVEYEYKVTISMRDSNSVMLLQKWKGSNKVHFTIADSLDGSLVYAKRFSANRFVYDSNDDSLITVRFIDDDGNIIRFHVVHTDEVDKLHQEVEDEA